MFSIQIDQQANIWERLLKLWLPTGGKIIDFTFGQGSLWCNIHQPNNYQLIKCDAVKEQKRDDSHFPNEIIVKDLLVDDYHELGLFDAGLFDPPYLIGRKAFDVSFGNPQHIAWDAKHSCNKNPEQFNARVVALNQKSYLFKEKGLLFVKVLDPRWQGKILPHHINITNLLTNFTLIDLVVYIRQGSTTFKIKRGCQNLHGYFLVYEKK
jgi:hypothetical protein